MLFRHACLFCSVLIACTMSLAAQDAGAEDAIGMRVENGRLVLHNDGGHRYRIVQVFVSSDVADLPALKWKQGVTLPPHTACRLPDDAVMLLDATLLLDGSRYHVIFVGENGLLRWHEYVRRDEGFVLDRRHNHLYTALEGVPRPQGAVN